MAKTYVLTGRVHTKRADISFGRIEVKLDENQSAAASCDFSQITVVLNMPKLDGWIAPMIVAEDSATIMVGALAFLGFPYSPVCMYLTRLQ